MTHTGSMKFELKCTWYNMLFCVRVHVTQIIALWNRKKNPSQFKLMTWLLFLKWVGVCKKPLHATPAQGRVGQGQPRGERRSHKRRNKMACTFPCSENLCPVLSSLLYILFSLSPIRFSVLSLPGKFVVNKWSFTISWDTNPFWKSVPNYAEKWA